MSGRAAWHCHVLTSAEREMCPPAHVQNWCSLGSHCTHTHWALLGATNGQLQSHYQIMQVLSNQSTIPPLFIVTIRSLLPNKIIDYMRIRARFTGGQIQIQIQIQIPHLAPTTNTTNLYCHPMHISCLARSLRLSL